MTTIDLTRIVTDAVLREMRDASGLGLRVMAAERAGCSRQHLARVESGERALTATSVVASPEPSPPAPSRCARPSTTLHTKQQEFRSLTFGVDAAPSDPFANEQYFHTLTLATAPSE